MRGDLGLFQGERFLACHIAIIDISRSNLDGVCQRTIGHSIPRLQRHHDGASRIGAISPVLTPAAPASRYGAEALSRTRTNTAYLHAATVSGPAARRQCGGINLSALLLGIPKQFKNGIDL